MIEIYQIPALSDNYIYLIHEPLSAATAAIDPSAAEPVLSALSEKGWLLTYILNTHHHIDHVGGNLRLKEQTGCVVVGAKRDKNNIPGITVELTDKDIFHFGETAAHILEVPGHTLGDIAYWFQASNALFCGDTLFAMGCGRLFEGSAGQMWHSLSLLKELPLSTRIYCAHEYTQENGRFALTVEPNNRALLSRMNKVNRLRSKNLPTVPSALKEELATNPFLRVDNPAVHDTGRELLNPVEVFAKLRRRKDNFRG